MREVGRHEYVKGLAGPEGRDAGKPDGEKAYGAEQDAVADAMYLEELAYEAEQDAIADAMFFEELAYEAELACF